VSCSRRRACMLASAGNHAPGTSVSAPPPKGPWVNATGPSRGGHARSAGIDHDRIDAGPDDEARSASELDEQRRQMVERQLVARGIRSQAVLEATAAVPRERFVPSEYRHLAYADSPLPIG